jgi:MYXO-CTERM domain-containing protein
MRNTVCLLGLIAIVTSGSTSSIAADSQSATSAPAARVPLTPELLNEIQKSQYVDKSIQTTNGNAVGIYADVIHDKEGKPTFLAMQVYDNVRPTKDFAVVPWDMMRFNQQSRRIEMAATADYLRKAPKFDRRRIDALKNNPDEIAKLQQSIGSGMGGGAVAGTMGTQSGQGSSSSLTPTTTDDAQPQRGSVITMYVLGILAAAGLAFALLARRRA